MDALITEAKNGDKAFVRLIRMNKQACIKLPGLSSG